MKLCDSASIAMNENCELTERNSLKQILRGNFFCGINAFLSLYSLRSIELLEIPRILPITLTVRECLANK